MSRVTRRVAVAALLFVLAASLPAATYIIPPDADFIRAADAVAIVKIESSVSYRTDDGAIVTDHTAVVERALKSHLRGGARITITQRGGVVGDVGFRDTSEPRFLTGERTLLVLDRQERGRFRTASGELGKFSFVTDVESRSLLVRGASDGEIFGWDLSGHPHSEQTRDAAAFVRYIEQIVRGENPAPDYFVRESVALKNRVEVNSHFPGSAYLSDNARWQEQGFEMKNKNNQGGQDGGGIYQDAAALWNDDAGSDISMSYGGQDPNGVFKDTPPPDFANFILFDQADSGPLAGSVVGLASYWFGGTHQFGGQTYLNMVDCDVVIQIGFSGAVLKSIVGHELGHCLGFRHSNQGTPTTSDALMNSSVSGDSALKDWDKDAASHAYGSGATTCNPPTINGQPQGDTIASGQSSTLSVTAGGTGPFTYQWYRGTSGTTTNPVGSNSSSFSTGALTATTSFWVRVSHACSSNTVDSQTATITVECNPPQIQSGPNSVTITEGTSTQLSVSVTGSGPFTYQWFVGNSGNTNNPIGTSSPNLNTGILTSTTNFWVRVSHGCSSAVADSNTATVTTQAFVCPTVTVGVPTATQLSGTQYRLAITAGGGGGQNLNYQWYEGNTPGSGGVPVGTGATITVATPTSNKTYWVDVSNFCGNNAISTTVTVPGTCPTPVITTQPLDQSINAGASATLTIAFTSASAANVVWYRGVSGDKTTQVGTGASFNTGPLTQTTQFWASLTNQCGEAQSRTAIVSIACTQPVIGSISPAQTTSLGQKVTLAVTATGTAPLTYQWYEGPAGNTTKPVGTNAATFTSNALTESTQFWVKVSNGCGSANSTAVSVTVNKGRVRRAVRH